MKKLFEICVLAALTAAAGCRVLAPDVDYPDRDGPVSAVFVIIEDSYIGRNPGAAADLEMMSNMVSAVTGDITVLRDGQATKRNVKNAITRACSNELAVVFFTCHGGQERAAKPDRDFETDGKDEFVFLSDSSVSDNELWEIFQTSTGRVFAVFNCCNSGTMFRAPAAGYGFAAGGRASGNAPNVLSWGACGDGYAAVTSKEGGEFVKSIYRAVTALGEDATYNRVWTAVRNSTDLRKRQRPEANVTGDYSEFEDIPVFR